MQFEQKDKPLKRSAFGKYYEVNHKVWFEHLLKIFKQK